MKQLFFKNNLFNFYNLFDGESPYNSRSQVYLYHSDDEKEEGKTLLLKKDFIDEVAFSTLSDCQIVKTKNENVFILIVEAFSPSGQCYKITLN